jgi:dTDP-4-amino-4,6-dideoxy-D-glucose transaminase
MAYARLSLRAVEFWSGGLTLTEMIYVTRPYLPDLGELIPLLEEIWANRILTNQGPFHQKFQESLCTFLEAKHVSLMCNGTVALNAAIAAAEIEGEVITTPYSFVATTHSIAMAGLTPVFVDVRESDFTIDPSLIEAAITPRTSAILAVHVYGNPCDVDAIEAIAKRHNLTVIYDAAHAFGVRFRGQSLLTHGDFSTLSFHATKAFNTFEGGAVLSATEAGQKLVNNYRNFGFVDEVTIPAIGGNTKMSEFNAALGLLQLNHFEEVRRQRAEVDRRYRELLAGIQGIDILPIPHGVEPNYTYFPILVRPEFRMTRDELYEHLKAHGFYARRYFYPLLSTLPMYRDLPSAGHNKLPVATDVAEQILCLPMYHDLAEVDQARLAETIRADRSSNAPAVGIAG